MTALLPADLRARLDAEPVSAVLEYLAGRLGLDQGRTTLEAVFERGALARAYAHHRLLAGHELEQRGTRDAPDTA